MENVRHMQCEQIGITAVWLLTLLPLPKWTLGVYVTTPPFQFSGSLKIKVTPNPSPYYLLSPKRILYSLEQNTRPDGFSFADARTIIQASPDPAQLLQQKAFLACLILPGSFSYLLHF